MLRPVLGVRTVAAGLLAATTFCLTPIAAAAAATVKVARGDSVWLLARRDHTSVAEIVRLNHLRSSSFIRLGSILRLPHPMGAHSQPKPTTHASGTVTLEPGQSLWSLAVQFHTTVHSLAVANHISNPNRVAAGLRLRVVGGSVGFPAVLTSWHSPSSYRFSSSGYVPPAQRWLPSRLRADPYRLAMQPAFHHWAAVYGVQPSMLEAIDWWESGWQPAIISRTGAIGVGQLEPSTVSFVRTRLLGNASLNPWNPSQNIQMSARFLRYLLDRTNWNAPVALAAYYEGLGAVHKGYLPAETKRYVRGITAIQYRFSRANA